MSSDIAARVKSLRDRLGHPVIDGDGHLIEPTPLFQHYLQKTGGTDLVDRYQHELREHPTGSRGNRETGDMRGAWWGVVDDAYDPPHVMGPRLLYTTPKHICCDFSF